MKNRKVFNCLCGGELVVVDKYDDDLCLCVFKNHNLSKYSMNFFERIKAMIYILFNGNIWTDEIVLSYDEAKKLGDYLINE